MENDLLGILLNLITLNGNEDTATIVVVGQNVKGSRMKNEAPHLRTRSNSKHLCMRHDYTILQENSIVHI